MGMHKTLFTKKTLELFLKYVGFNEVKVSKIKLKDMDKTEIVGFGIK